MNCADFRPLFLLHERSLQFGAKGHMIDVIQHDADHVPREMLEPRDRDDLTELQREEKSVQDTRQKHRTPNIRHELTSVSLMTVSLQPS